jgi:thiol-disulfide isomerase/thioredoxin
MSEVQGSADRGDRRGVAILGAVVVAVVVAAVLGLLYVKRQHATEMAGPARPGIERAGPLAQFSRGDFASLETWKSPKTAPPPAFVDADGKPVSLASFRGKVVVMNVWATWCVPCRVEMPALAALQRRYPNDIAVVPVSVDRDTELATAKSFIGVNEPLALYHDPNNFMIPGKLGFHQLPSTVIYDRQGREVARFIGPAPWDTPASFAFIDALLKLRD